MNLKDLKKLAMSKKQRDFYDIIGCSYEEIDIHNGIPSNFPLLAEIDWIVSPDKEILKRFFNQVNTHFGEQIAIEDADTQNPINLLNNLNSTVLYRQGKSLGFRERDITFGQRKHLDFFDHRRSYQWLYGLSPKHIEDMLMIWAQTVDRAPKCLSNAFALTMILIAIHPFSDGNGRIARIAFSWLCRRWGLEQLWMAEDDDGEFLRTGCGISSTEYLMAMFMLSIASGNNSVDPSGRLQKPNENSDEFRRCLSAYTRKIAETSPGNIGRAEFEALFLHMHHDGHFKDHSPRFDCLNQFIVQ